MSLPHISTALAKVPSGEGPKPSVSASSLFSMSIYGGANKSCFNGPRGGSGTLLAFYPPLLRPSFTLGGLYPRMSGISFLFEPRCPPLLFFAIL